MCMSYTDVAQVANAARNYEILHERDDDDDVTERPDKRQRSGDRHQPTSQQSSHRSHGQNNDRHGSDRRGGNDNHRSSNNKNTLAITTGIPVMDGTRETGVISPTDLPILVLSNPGVPLRVTPIQFALLVDVDTKESVVELQWKSRIKRYIDTKPNRELIHFCLTNPPYDLGWKDKPILDSEGNPTTTTQQVFETYKNVTHEIRDQLNAEAEAVQIILTGIDNDIYLTVDACPNACEKWKAIERLKQGISITRDSKGIFLSKKKYALDLLDKAHMATCNPTWTPVDTESKLGSDVQQVCLREPYFAALKRVLRYVHGTLDLCLQLYASSTSSLGILYSHGHLNANILFLDQVLSNSVQHQRTKHIEIDIHFVCDMVSCGQETHAFTHDEQRVFPCQKKSKIQWLKEGDANSAYFHKAVKSHVSRSRIDTVTNSEGVVFDNNTVYVAFVKHYEMFLSQEGETSNFNYANLFNVRLNDQEAQNMVCEISNQEVKDAIFSIGDDKSPGPIIANDVYLAVSEFFRNGTLLKEINHTIIALLPKCVTSTSYSICVNGSLHGYFKGKRGLRQGDPISPYLFTLVMEVLTLMLQRKVHQTDQFTYHRYCSKMELVNLCFADDLFLFAYGDVGSASIFKEALDEFKNALGLVSSLPKSKLPVKYLEVPLVSSRLMIHDCNELVDKSHGSSGKGKSKVAWEIVCLPKHEGGLGIQRLECFNSALMASHIWKLLTLKESLWKFIWSKIGNGRNTSLWFDMWADFEPLAAQISPRDIARSGLSLQSKRMLLVWRNIHGNVKKFLVSQVWDDIRHRDFEVNWYNMVWFPSCIPRHAINLWLITQRKLKTQNLVPMWDVFDSLGMVCSLCESVPDSHDHLFFECPFAKGIWDRVKVCAGLAHYTPNVYDIIHSLMPIMKRRTTNSMVAKLVVVAATYYVWQERNWRLFKKGKRSPDQIVECIKFFVRLKLLSCKLKKSKNGERLARLWDLPKAVFK
nr:putative reverse transcriptase domain, reverse transcriptase zinc-binding domain protein [Tanacetum cinerariifolium]